MPSQKPVHGNISRARQGHDEIRVAQPLSERLQLVHVAREAVDDDRLADLGTEQRLEVGRRGDVGRGDDAGDVVAIHQLLLADLLGQFGREDAGRHLLAQEVAHGDVVDLAPVESAVTELGVTCDELAVCALSTSRGAWGCGRSVSLVLDRSPPWPMGPAGMLDGVTHRP